MYLIYIEMLGHDTSWAQATAIQLCSDKNLAVKKVGAGGHGWRELPAAGNSWGRIAGFRYAAGVVAARCGASLAVLRSAACSPPNPAHPCCRQMAYLAVSLLLDPASELSIMVVATIQADLRSDNFLTGGWLLGCGRA